MRNELNQFGYLQPTSVSDAVSLLTKYGSQAKIIAGGSDLLTEMKNQIEFLTPKYVVDITGLNLNKITYSGSSGLTIGATTNIATIKTDTNVNQYLPSTRSSGHRAPRPDS